MKVMRKRRFIGLPFLICLHEHKITLKALLTFSMQLSSDESQLKVYKKKRIIIYS